MILDISKIVNIYGSIVVLRNDFYEKLKKKNCFQNVTQTFETLSTVLGLFSMVQ